MGNYTAPARRVEDTGIDLAPDVQVETAPLGPGDLCDSSAIGSETASVRFAKGSLVLDLCGHHAYAHGGDLLADGWVDVTTLSGSLWQGKATLNQLAPAKAYPLGRHRAAAVEDHELPDFEG